MYKLFILLLLPILILIYFYKSNKKTSDKQDEKAEAEKEIKPQPYEDAISEIVKDQLQECSEDLVKCPDSDKLVSRAKWNNCGANLIQCMNLEDMMKYNCTQNMVKCPDSNKKVSRVPWNKCGPDLSQCFKV